MSAALAKSAVPNFYTTAGQTITYSYTVMNTGSSPICDNIQICDDKLGGWYIPCSYIYPGSSQVFSRTYTITPADLSVQSITNTASAFIQIDKCNGICTLPASATITNGSADVSGNVSIVLSEPNLLNVMVSIYNSGTSLTEATGISLFIPTPMNASINSLGPLPPIPGTTVVPEIGGVKISIPTLAIGATQSFTAVVWLPTITTPGASYTAAGTILTSTFDPNTSNNNVTATYTF